MNYLSTNYGNLRHYSSNLGRRISFLNTKPKAQIFTKKKKKKANVHLVASLSSITNWQIIPTIDEDQISLSLSSTAMILAYVKSFRLIT